MGAPAHLDGVPRCGGPGHEVSGEIGLDLVLRREEVLDRRAGHGGGPVVGEGLAVEDPVHARFQGPIDERDAQWAPRSPSTPALPRLVG